MICQWHFCFTTLEREQKKIPGNLEILNFSSSSPVLTLTYTNLNPLQPWFEFITLCEPNIGYVQIISKLQVSIEEEEVQREYQRREYNEYIITRYREWDTKSIDKRRRSGRIGSEWIECGRLKMQNSRCIIEDS